MGGDITYAPAYGGGACFVLQLRRHDGTMIADTPTTPKKDDDGIPTMIG